MTTIWYNSKSSSSSLDLPSPIRQRRLLRVRSSCVEITPLNSISRYQEVVQFSTPSHLCRSKGYSVCGIVLKMCTWQKWRLAHQKGEGSCRWWRCMSSLYGTYISQGSELQRKRRKMRWGKTGEGRSAENMSVWKPQERNTSWSDCHRWGWSIILIDEKTTLMMFVLFGQPSVIEYSDEMVTN